MAEQQPILLALGRGHNGFYDMASRFHLVGVIKPQALWPADVPFTDDIKRALQTGTLVDVNGVVALEDVKYEYTSATPTTSNDRKKAQMIAAEEAAKEAEEKGEEVPAKVHSDLLSESDIDGADKKELVAFIKKNELELEGINSRSTLDDLKQALKVHFGYVTAEDK